MTKAQMLQAMCQRTGLAKNTIKDLMKHGWSYEEIENNVRLFKGPEASVKQSDLNG